MDQFNSTPKREWFRVPKPASSLLTPSPSSMQNGNGKGRLSPPASNSNKGPPKSGMSNFTLFSTTPLHRNSVISPKPPGINSPLVSNLEPAIDRVETQLSDLNKKQEEKINTLTTYYKGILDSQKSIAEQNKSLVGTVETLNSVIVKMGDQMSELVKKVESLQIVVNGIDKKTTEQKEATLKAQPNSLMPAFNFSGVAQQPPASVCNHKDSFGKDEIKKLEQFMNKSESLFDQNKLLLDHNKSLIRTAEILNKTVEKTDDKMTELITKVGKNIETSIVVAAGADQKTKTKKSNVDKPDGKLKDKDAKAPSQTSMSVTTKPKSQTSSGSSSTSTPAAPAPAHSFQITPPKFTPVEPAVVITTAQKQPSLSEMFKKAEGSWDCEICYVHNSKDATSCIACQTVKPGCEGLAAQTTEAPVPIPQFNFGFGTPTTSQTVPAPTVPTPKETTSSVYASPSLQFSFGSPSPATLTSASTPTLGSILSGTPNVAPASVPSTSFSFFGNPSTSTGAGFNFNLKTNGTNIFSPNMFSSPNASSTPQATQGTTPGSARKLSADDDVADVEREDHSIQFQPLIPLPPLVETKTGEEDEDILWSIRSKLFRLRDKEWKERAIGDMKILKHRETGKCRLMIRRGTDKIGLNQPIKPDLTLKLMKDEKSVMWGAVDFSDGDPTPDSFLLRVKQPSDAKEFITKVQELVKEAVNDDAPKPPVTVLTVSSSSFTDRNASQSTGEEKDTADAEREDDNIQFKPLIPLPPLVQTKTGEEDEDVLWAMHSKLFRMRNREWKERALGEMKILKHRETGKCRLMIRRGTDKIGLNQPIKPDLTPTLMKDDKSVMWGGVDFSDGEASIDTFLLRLKSPANAKEFIAKLLEVVQEAETSSTSLNVGPNDSGVASTDDVDKARKLMLPDDFFNSSSSSQCQGCVGCDPDSFNFAALDKNCEELKKFNESESTKGWTPKSRSTTRDTASAPIQTPKPTLESMYEAITPDNSPQKEEVPKQNPFSAFSFTLDATPTKPDDNAATLSSSGSGSLSLKSPSFAFASPTSLSNSSPAVQSSIFGSGSSSQSIFGSGSSSSQSIFGMKPFGLTDNTSPKSDTPAQAKVSDGPINGNSLSSFSFTSPTTPQKAATEGSPKSIFGGVGGLFTDNSPSQTPPSYASVDFEALSKGSSTFGDIANKEGFAFGKPIGEKTTQWNVKSSNVQVFGTSNANDSRPRRDSANEEHQEEDGYDPHYEPVLAELPPLVEEITGEENHTQLYCQLAKVYRYEPDTKEWKERGIGDVKLIQSNENQRIRIIQWRRQVKTLALNHYVTPDTEIKPLKNCLKSWCWAARDYADPDFPEGKDENFAIRFKDEKLAAVFKEMYDKCRETMRGVLANAPPVLPQSIPTTNATEYSPNDGGKSQTHGSHEEVGEEEEEEEEDDSVEQCMFQGDAELYENDGFEVEIGSPGLRYRHIGRGTVKVVYDGDQYVAKVMVYQNEVVLIEHFIAVDTALVSNEAELTYEWSAVNNIGDHAPMKRALKARFDDISDFHNFAASIADGMGIAAEDDITESSLLEYDAEHAN